MTLITATPVNPWEKIATDYKSRLLSQIPPSYLLPPTDLLPINTSNLVQTSALFTPKEHTLLALDATALRDAIAEKKYTAVEVTTAYLKAAAICHQATSCLMDYFPEEALERAKWLDEQLESTGKTVGPLHGVPISVKDHLALKGHEITAGFASWVGKNIPDKDSVIISILRSAGAVFYVKTTNPQAIMHLETDSFLGPTVNPYNRALTAGGSSGGEGALIGGGGSVLGIGTDIGGSIRNPCALNGIFGFKPTSVRLPKFGNKSEMIGQESIVGAIGPMGRSVRDLGLFITTILSAEPWLIDPTNVGMPWRPEVVSWGGNNGENGETPKPKVGVMWNDGVVKPQPPMRRALKFAVDRLREKGFEVVDFEPYGKQEAWDITRQLYFTDGGERIRKAAASTGEPILPLTQWIISQSSPALASVEVFELVKRRELFRAEYYAHFLQSGIDVILCPPSPGPAPRLGTSKYWNYTALFNLVDFPSGVFPTGLFVEDVDVAMECEEWLSEEDQKIQELYNVKDFLGAPLSLQVAGHRWQDEKVLAALDMISAAVRE